MTPEEFLKNKKGWEEKDKGSFDFRGLSLLLGEYGRELQHYKDTTVGLYATDRPDLLTDKQEILFQLK